MKRPTEQQFIVATAWLDYNDGGGDEKKACQAVADWLRHQEQQAFLRSQARKIWNSYRFSEKAP